MCLFFFFKQKTADEMRISVWSSDVCSSVLGGMPAAAVQLHQDRARGPMTGTALIRPYAAAGASLALTPVSFTATPDGATHFTTTATLSGPLGDGRIENARMPISGVWNGAGRLLVNRQCAPLSFDSLAVSSLVPKPTRLTLCPQGRALLAIDGAALSGGARLAAEQLDDRESRGAGNRVSVR